MALGLRWILGTEISFFQCSIYSGMPPAVSDVAVQTRV